MVVASRDSGYFCRAHRDNPGRAGRKCLAMVVSSVDNDGDQSAAWWKVMMSAGVLWFIGWVATLAAPVGGGWTRLPLT